MPGVSATVAEQIEALRNAAGEKAVRLSAANLTMIMKIVSGWPQAFEGERAEEAWVRGRCVV